MRLSFASRCTVLGSALLLTPVAACATSCGLEAYYIEGSLEDARTGHPVVGATVFIFLNEQELSFPAGYKTTYPDFTVSDSTGRFGSRSFLDTYNGRRFLGLGGPRCNGELEAVEIVVSSVGYLSRRRIFERFELEATEERPEPTLRLPPVQLFPSSSEGEPDSP